MFTGLVLSLAALVNGATVSVTPDIVAAGVARASTPYKADRPVSQATVASLLAAYDGSNFTAMWAQADAYDAANSDGTECRAFMLQYEFSLRLMPERVPLRDVFDSLNLNTKCGITPPTAPASTAYFKPLTPSEITATCTAPGSPYYVDATGGSDSNSGTMASPFQTLPKALAATRASGPRSQGQSACIVLRGGVHHLATTMTLGAADSGLVFTALAGDAGGPAWVSGGVPLGPLSWTPYDLTSGRNIYVADISPSVPLSSMPGLNSLSSTGAMPTRFWRARYPNTFDLEQFTGQLPDMGAVEKWVKAPLMDIPEMYFMDLKAAGLKNDSTMQEYNWYQAARGGPCEHWARDGESWSYVCGNSTAGGWEFIEKNFASSGQLGFPVSMVYNKSKLPASFASWTMPTPAARTDWSNTPTLTAWHNQGWFQATYAITGIDTAAGQLTLTADDVFPSGGWQGGRTMESCSAYNTSYEAPLCSGPWYVMNVFQELDYPNEYFFDPTARKLYLFYNDTSGTPPPSDFSLVSQQLEVFFDLSGTPSAPVSDVTFAGLGLRDQRDGQLVKWVDPSGGDWGIRRAGLFHLEGTHRVNITGSTFFRTDANAVMVAAYNRNASVVDCEFAFIGMSAVVTFGQTIQEDGTQGTQPFGTLIAYNKVHEIGAYQLQSSAWFTSRATLTRAEGLVVFNIPRAAINLNDAFGGGNNITLSSIWHTCRQSGDHGPINSWDRMPFLTNIASGGNEATYTPAYTSTSHSMIIADYGASQSFDNDDGSSYYDTHDNFFYDASGFKMDFGGHDSRFHSNVIIALHGQDCIGSAGFVAGHATQHWDNDCVVYGTETVTNIFENCWEQVPPGNSPIHGFNNRYYTKKANASATCDCCGLRPLAQLPAGLDDNFTSSLLPIGATIIGWGRDKLFGGL